MIDQLVLGRRLSIHFLVLLFLGALLAGVAELPYGGWIQIPLLSVLWYWLDTEKPNSLKRLFVSGLIMGTVSAMSSVKL